MRLVEIYKKVGGFFPVTPLFQKLSSKNLKSPSSHHRRNGGVLAASSAADCRRYAVVLRLERRIGGVSVAYIRRGNES